MSPTPRQFGKRLRAAREAAGMSQGELARKAGVTRPYINRLEGGQHDVSLSTLTRLARALGITVSRLVDTEGGG